MGFFVLEGGGPEGEVRSENGILKMKKTMLPREG